MPSQFDEIVTNNDIPLNLFEKEIKYRFHSAVQMSNHYAVEFLNTEIPSGLSIT